MQHNFGFINNLFIQSISIKISTLIIWLILSVTFILFNDIASVADFLILFWIIECFKLRWMIVLFFAKSNMIAFVRNTTAIAKDQTIIAVSCWCFCTHPIGGIFVFSLFTINESTVQQINASFAVPNEFPSANCQTKYKEKKRKSINFNVTKSVEH